MQIRFIHDGDASGIREFGALPYRIYRDNELWVPPMNSEIQLLFDRDRHPFYESSEAVFLLAEQRGQTVGRLAVIDNRDYNDYTGRADAFFGYFESIEDQSVAEALFEAASRWAKARGLERIAGARGLLHGDGLGILVEGFEYPPALGIPYNPPYYGEMFESLGFRTQHDYYSGYLTDQFALPERLHRIAEWVKQRRGYWVREFRTKADLRQVVPLIREVYNAAFSEAPDFYPMGEREVEIVAARLLAVARPELIKLVYQDQDLVGFLFAYPNIGRGIRRARGRMWPFGWFPILWELMTTHRLDINGVGVMPGHQGAGANAVMYVELEKALTGSRFTHADTVQVRDDNLKSLGDNAALGVRWYKRHRIYQRRL